jgi:hypothetical protein
MSTVVDISAPLRARAGALIIPEAIAATHARPGCPDFALAFYQLARHVNFPPLPIAKPAGQKFPSIRMIYSLCFP